MRRHRFPLLLVLALLTLAGCGNDGPDASQAPSEAERTGPSAAADLLGPGGENLGSVTLTFDAGATVVDVTAQGLSPGPHGFHVHKSGTCEAASPDPTDPTKTGDFLSAGGHLAADGQEHGDHDGDLPSLIVAQDGTASLTTPTDRLGMDDVLDDDGSAVMIHAKPDNFGNIPERYAPGGPDETTTKTGDSGDRVACGVLRTG